MKRYLLLAVSLLLSSLGSSCVQEPQRQTHAKARTAASLRAFTSADELRQYLADQVQAQNTASTRGGYVNDVFTPTLALSTPAPASAGNATGAEDSQAGGSGGSDPFSTTNIQEEGVDESDIVKNDGNSIFALDGDKIHVVKASPAEQVAEVATIALPFTGNSLYLKGTTLIAISSQYSYYYGGGPVPLALKADDAVSSDAGQGSAGSTGSVEPSAPVGGPTGIVYPYPYYSRPEAIVSLFDVSDPANPALTATVRFDGTLADSRLIASKLHLILQTTPILPVDPTPEALKAQDLSTWIPDFKVTGPDGAVVSSGDVVSFAHVFRPDDPDGYGIVTVVMLDVDHPEAPFASTSITADAGTIYASTEALYITDTNYDYSTFTSRVDTAIHKLALTDSGTEYRASGIVPGRPLNSYSLGEFNGNLRIATHIDPEFMIAVEELDSPPPSVVQASGTGSSGSGDATASSTGTSSGNASSSVATVTQVSPEGNAVYVLSENTDKATLDIVGRVEDIATGEQIYAARFVGERGFLVTFHRVDPLFTLDLSDPTNPHVAGELKVPGYSDHIQLLDANHLLTIGKDVQDAGQFAWVRGVQISLFDVTDLANPTLLDKAVIGGRGTSSEANYNPKAFNYFAARNALAFPIDDYSGETSGPEIGRHDFTGLYVFHVTVADGFQFLGRISSGGGTDKFGCLLSYYGFTRGVFIGDDVYSVTQRGVKAANLSDVSTLIGQTTFPSAPDLYPDCFFYYANIVLPEGDGLK